MRFATDQLLIAPRNRSSPALRRFRTAAAPRTPEEARPREASAGFNRQPHHLLWDGQSFAGRDVLIRCNHGLGDTIQFVRYVPRVHAIARQVTLLVQPHLVKLLSACRDLGNVADAWTNR